MGNCGGGEVKIETIDESSKQLQTLPKALTRSAIRKSIRQVNLSNNDLKEIDAKFWLNVNLEEVILSGNKNFELIPDQVATLMKLTRLDLSATGLKKINNFLWSLPKLAWLDVSKTSISTLGDLNGKALSYLDISDTNVSELPDSISNLSNLRVLKANRNKLKKVPKSLGKCAKLAELHIESNDEVKFLPNEPNIKGLKVLRIIPDQPQDECELFETVFEGETVLSCTYFNCPTLVPIVPKRVDSLGKSKESDDEDAPIAVTLITEEHTVKAEVRIETKEDSKPEIEPESKIVEEFEVIEKGEVEAAQPEEDLNVKSGEQEFAIINDYHFRGHYDERKVAEAMAEVAEVANEQVVMNEQKSCCQVVVEKSGEESDKKDSGVATLENVENEETVDDVKTAEVEQNSASVEDSAAVTMDIKIDETAPDVKAYMGANIEGSENNQVVEDAEQVVVKMADDTSQTTVTKVVPSTVTASITVAGASEATVKEYLGANIPPVDDHVKEELTNEQPDEAPMTNGKPPLSPKPILTTSDEDNVKTEDNKVEQNNTEETKSDSDDEVMKSKTDSDNHKTEIMKSRGVGSVRRSMMMFEKAQEESAKAKPSTPNMTRRLSQRTAYRTDQPSQTGDNVVRVAVPIPENYKEKKVERTPIKTGRVDVLFDSEAPAPVSPRTKEALPAISPTIAHAPDLATASPIEVTEQQSVEKTSVRNTTMTEIVTESKRPVTKTETSELTFSFSSIKIEEKSLSPPQSPEKMVMSESFIESIDQILKEIDFESEPREVVTKASRTKGASLGLSIITAEEEQGSKALANNVIIVKEVLEITGTTWGGERPKPGDVLASIDGSNVTDDNVHDVIGDCGNLIQLKFLRYPSAFTGYK